MSQKINVYSWIHKRHEDKDLYYDTAFIRNNSSGCKYWITYHYINAAVGAQ